jgi:hypothetical protein
LWYPSAVRHSHAEPGRQQHARDARQGTPGLCPGAAGDVDNALDLIDEQISQIERPGWEERRAYAEILQFTGWMLSIGGDLEGAQRDLLTSLDCARRQRAKSRE